MSVALANRRDREELQAARQEAERLQQELQAERKRADALEAAANKEKTEN